MILDHPPHTSPHARYCAKCGSWHLPSAKHCPYCSLGHIFHDYCPKRPKTPVQEKLW